MVNYHADLVNLLNKILPTYYELTLNSDCQIPCISYSERNSYANETGDTIGYSTVSYQIKVWGNSISEIQAYALQIEEALRPLGWKRTSSNEVYDRNSTMIQKILVYDGFFHETF